MSSSGRTKTFEFFCWLNKKSGRAAEMKITKLHASHFTSGADGPNFAGALHEKKANQMATIPYRSEGIVKGPRNQSSTSSATMSSAIVIIVFCCSIREGEKGRLKILVFWPFQFKEKGKTKSSYKHNKYYAYST